jgi:hypothetical protein
METLIADRQMRTPAARPQTPIGDTDRLIAAGLLLRMRRRVS